MKQYFRDQYGFTVKGVVTIILLIAVPFFGILIAIDEHDYQVRIHNVMDTASCNFLQEWIIEPQNGTWIKNRQYHIALDEYNKRCLT